MMEYQGPEPADLTNVCALNIAYLDWLRARGNVRDAEVSMTPEISAALAGMTRQQLERLSRVPFLLMSFREYDEAQWRSLFAETPAADLFRPAQGPDEDAARLISAGLGFLWQLSKRNPYAARLVSGANLNWCEQLAERTLVELLSRAVTEYQLLEPRMFDNADLWRRLLSAGISAKKDVRMAARVSALQTVLTRSDTGSYRQLAAAACSMPRVAVRVADRSSR
jgi:hypothetical protein